MRKSAYGSFRGKSARVENPLIVGEQILLLNPLSDYCEFAPKNALVFGPKYPADGLIPFADWNLTSAAFVSEPNLVVSFPREPGPLFATVKPCALSQTWSALTSSPIEPSFRSRLKLAFGLALSNALILGSAPPNATR